jgi:MFS family permease
MRPVYLLFIAIFAMSIGFGIMTPAVSLYSVLGFGVNEWELGILGALTSLPYAIGPAFFGRYSDRAGRKPLVLGGACIYTGVALAYVVAPSIAFLALLRILEGICFSLIWPVSEAWVGDLSKAGDRRRMIGHYSVAWSSGYMLGPFLLGIMVTYTNIAYSFVLAASLVLASVPILLRVKSSDEKNVEPERGGKGEGGIATVAVLFAMVVWGVSQLAYFFLLPAYALDMGFPAAYSGYLIGTVALFRTIVFVAYSRLVEKLKSWMLPIGTLLVATSMLITWTAKNIEFFALASCILGIAFGMIYAFSLGHVLDRPAKGFYAGLFESAIGIGQIAGPLSMGYIGFAISPSSPYLAMGLLGAASAVGISGALLRAKKRAP